MKRIGILTSGGDAPGMNAAVRAVVRTAIYNEIEIYGIFQGYNGLLNGDIKELNLSSVGDIIHRGGTILRSARCDEFKTESGLNKALNIIDVFNLEGLIILGGDGSFMGAHSLHKRGVPVIAIPCTIDNDMGYTDYTIGFYTAVETVVDAISKIRDTSASHGRANIVEVMGRNCGDIALYSGLAGGGESIIVPNVVFDIDEVSRKIIQGRNRGKLHHIIVLAEGVRNAYDLGREIEEKTGSETRVTILGHIQRGGTPTVFDRILGSKMGYRAVELLKENKSGLGVGIKDNNIISMDIDKAIEMKREFDLEMYEMAKILSI